MFPVEGRITPELAQWVCYDVHGRIRENLQLMVEILSATVERNKEKFERVDIVNYNAPGNGAETIMLRMPAKFAAFFYSNRKFYVSVADRDRIESNKRIAVTELAASELAKLLLFEDFYTHVLTACRNL
jgi:hypothetical protein